MVAMAYPLVDLFRGGVFSPQDAETTARYFVIFSFSIALWTVQGIYARAFYAAGNTRTPAIAGWAVTLASIPVYRVLFARMGLPGLAIASDVGILVQTLTLGVLLHARGLVRAEGIEWDELGRAGVAAIAGFEGAALCLRYLPVHPGYGGDFVLLAAGSLAWLGCGWAVLVGTKSKLPAQILRRGR
jgi:putative peptidoglycan lipid II flippase